MITVITTITCPWCTKVKNLLKMHEIPFQEWQPDLDTLRTFMLKHNVRTVPQVFLDDPLMNADAQRIGGFEDTQAWINRGQTL